MQKPPENVGSGKILRNSRRVLGRLKSHPKAAPIGVKFQPVHVALKKAVLEYNDADDVALDTAAAVDMCDAVGREALTDFQLALVAKLRREYGAPEYISYFPVGFGDAKALSGAELQKFLGATASKLAALPKTDVLAVHAKPVQAASDAYKAPLLEDEKAQAVLTHAGTQLAVARAQWLVSYDGLYGEVRQLFAGHRSLADSFFVSWTRKATKQTPAAGQAASGNDAEAGN